MSGRMRVLDVHPLAFGANPAVDALAHSLADRLAAAGVETRVVAADFLDPGWAALTEESVAHAVELGFDAVVLYVIEPDALKRAVGIARAARVPVFTFARSPVEVTGSLVYPNFYHGLYIAEFLAARLPPGAKVGLIPGPLISDGREEMAGVVYGSRVAGLQLVNDPETDERYRNPTDASDGGYEAARHLLADFPQLDGLVPYNDETMLGTVRALRELGRLGEAKIASRNGSPQAVEAVRRGETDGTWDIDIPGMGAALADLVIRRLIGREELDGELVMAPIGRMISRENVDDWRPWSDLLQTKELRFGLD